MNQPRPSRSDSYTKQFEARLSDDALDKRPHLSAVSLVIAAWGLTPVVAWSLGATPREMLAVACSAAICILLSRALWMWIEDV